jgi:hypothetical protein
MKISILEKDIKDVVLKSNDWTHGQLLQLAKIANDEVRSNKFDDFKKGIDKKSTKAYNFNKDV